MNRLSLGVALLVVLSVVAMPAVGAESWKCTFTDDFLPSGVHNIAKVDISGDKLLWRVQFPTQPLTPNAGTKWEAFPSQVLENNDVGIVAVSSQAKLDRSAGPLLGAEVIVIKKSNGDLRVGSIAANGVHDLMRGSCRAE